MLRLCPMLVRFLRERQQRLFAARHERLSSCACRTRPRNFVLHLTHFGEMRREPYSCQGSVTRFAICCSHLRCCWSASRHRPSSPWGQPEADAGSPRSRMRSTTSSEKSATRRMTSIRSSASPATTSTTRRWSSTAAAWMRTSIRSAYRRRSSRSTATTIRTATTFRSTPRRVSAPAAASRATA